MISDKHIENIFKTWAKHFSEIEGFKEDLKFTLNSTIMRKLDVPVYPEKKNIFRIFKELDYENVKVIMIAQDPYHDGSADGFAFSNSLSKKLSPSLRNIFTEINPDIDYINRSLWNLKRWVDQGVFLYNTSLTVIKGTPGSDLELWRNFTRSVIQVLNKKSILIWILLGKNSQSFKKYINKDHIVIEAPHPASEIYSGGTSGFFGSGIFQKCNEKLKENNLLEIKW